jgi:hypothetical protein
MQYSELYKLLLRLFFISAGIFGWLGCFNLSVVLAQPSFRDTVWTMSSSKDTGSIWMGGLLDSENTRYIGDNYQTAYGYQPMRYLRITNEDSVPAFGPKLLLNRRGNWYSRLEIGIEALDGTISNKEKALALFQFMRHNRIHYEPAEHPFLDETHEPVKVLGVYGYAFCDDAAFSLKNIAQNMNIGGKEWLLTAHSTSEVVFGNDEMVLDADLEVFYPAQDNLKLASKNEINNDRNLAARILHYGIDIPYIQEVSKHISKMFTSFDPIEYRNPAPHELYYTLLPEQSVYFTWERQDSAYEHRIWGAASSENMRDHHIGNAFWEHALNPDSPGFNRQFSTSLNLKVNTSGNGLRMIPMDVTQPLHIVHKIDLPFLQLDHQVFYDVTLPVSGDTLRVEWSTDSLVWTTVKTQSGPYIGQDSCSLYALVAPQLNPAIYKSFIRVSLHQSDSLMPAGLDSLRFQSRTQNSKTFLPYLRKGWNQWEVSRKDSLQGNLKFEIAWNEDSSNNPAFISSVPVYPGNGITTDTAQILFRWGNAQDQDPGDYPVKYHFQLSDRPDMKYCLASNFDRIINPISPSVMAYPAFKPEVPGFLNHGQSYYWRVRSMDNRGLWGDWSPVWNFTVQCVMPPRSGSVALTDSNLVISWNAGMPGKIPAHYAVHGSNEMSGFTPSASTLLGTTQDSTWVFPLGQIPPPAYIRIIAIDQNGEESQPSDCINTPFPFVYTFPNHTVYPDSILNIALPGNARYFPFWSYFYPDTVFYDAWVSPISYPSQLVWDSIHDAFSGQFDSSAVRSMNFLPSLNQIRFQVLAPYSTPINQTISLNASIPNLKPQLESFLPNSTLGVSISDTLDLLDKDADYGDTHTWQILRCPAWLNVSVSNDKVILLGTPTYAAIVDTTLWLVVEDSKGLTDTLWYQFDFIIQNNAPQIQSVPDTLVDVAQLYLYSITVMDPDTAQGDSVSLNIQQGPSWLSLNPQSRHLSGYPNVSPVADSLVILRATDLTGAWVEQVFVLHFKYRPDSQTGVEMPEDWLDSDKLAIGIYPNPASELAYLKYRLPHHGQVQIDLFDAQGMRLQEILSGFGEPGVRQVVLSVKHLPAGIYWVQCRFTSEDFQERIYTSKLVLIR